MSGLANHLKGRVDSMTTDQLVYLFIPEILAMKQEAELNKQIEKTEHLEQVIAYVKDKVQLDKSMVISDDMYLHRLYVPAPHQIINAKSPADIPNN